MGEPIVLADCCSESIVALFSLLETIGKTEAILSATTRTKISAFQKYADETAQTFDEHGKLRY